MQRFRAGSGKEAHAILPALRLRVNEARGSTNERFRHPTAKPALVSRSRRSRQHRPPHRALHELRDHPGGTPVGEPDHRHRPVRQRPLALQPGAPAAHGAGTGRDPGRGRGSSRVPRAPDPGDRKAPHRRPRPEPRLPRPRRGAARVSARRGGAHHRMRQDHPVAAHGRGHREHPRHRALGGADARRLVPGQARRLGHDRVGGAQALRGRGDRLRGVHRDGGLFGEVRRALQHHGHGLHDELTRRGARDGASRVRGHPRPVQGARAGRVRDRAPDRRDGPRGRHPLRKS